MAQKTVLIVDDQRFVRDVVGKALKGVGGYRVLEAEDGMAAIRLMEGAGPVAAGMDLAAEQLKPTIDCVVSDISMLPMNGLEFLKAIRIGLTPTARDTPVIMLTGHAEKNLLATAIALDTSGFIVKPASAKVLHERIARAIAGRHVVKSVADYTALIIPDVEAPDSWSSGAAMRPVSSVHASDLAGGQYVSQAVPTSGLQAGDRLAEDLETQDGILVVPHGVRVTAALLPALRDLEELVSLKPNVAVFRV